MLLAPEITARATVDPFSLLLREMGACRALWGSADLVASVSALYACVDESGIHEGASICVLAGYMGSRKQMERFSDAWMRVLSACRAPAFHAKEFFHRKGMYKDWPHQRRDALLVGLVDAIRLCRVFPFGAMVDVAAFNALTYNERKFLTGGVLSRSKGKWIAHGAPSKPYFLAFTHCLIEAAKQAKPGMVVHFVFDQQKEFAPRALETFAEAKLTLRNGHDDLTPRLGNCTFMPHGDVPPVQAADLLAHCGYHQWSGGTKLQRQYPSLLQVLMERSRRGVAIYDTGSIAMMLSKIPADIKRTLNEI